MTSTETCRSENLPPAPSFIAGKFIISIKLQKIKRLIKIAEQETPSVEHDLTHLKEILDNDFASIYSSFSREEKRHFWKSILSEIKLNDNRLSGVVFKY